MGRSRKFEVAGKLYSKADIFQLNRHQLHELSVALRVEVVGYVSDSVVKCLLLAKLSGEDFHKLLYEADEFENSHQGKAEEQEQEQEQEQELESEHEPKRNGLDSEDHRGNMESMTSEVKERRKRRGRPPSAGGPRTSTRTSARGSTRTSSGAREVQRRRGRSRSAAERSSVEDSHGSRDSRAGNNTAVAGLKWLDEFPSQQRGFAKSMRWRESEVCNCCGGPDSTDDDAIGYCDGCDVGVHSSCYEADFSKAEFFCDSCGDTETPDEFKRCALCPVKKGALMKVHGRPDRYVHVACAFWHPQLTVDYKTRTIRGCGLIGQDRRNLACILCGSGGGGVLQCNAVEAVEEAELWERDEKLSQEGKRARRRRSKLNGCRRAFHVLCARSAGWLTLYSNKLENGFVACCDVHTRAQSIRSHFDPQHDLSVPPEVGGMHEHGMGTVDPPLGSTQGPLRSVPQMHTEVTTVEPTETSKLVGDAEIAHAIFLCDNWRLFTPLLSLTKEHLHSTNTAATLGSVPQDRLDKMRAKLSLPMKNKEQPEGLTGGRLRTFQLDGLSKLQRCKELGVGAAVADEIGRYVQVVAFALTTVSEAGSNPDVHPALILSTAQKLPFWVAEFRKWAPSLRVRRRFEPNASPLGGRKDMDVVLASYDIAADRQEEFQVPWTFVALDDYLKAQGSLNPILIHSQCTILVEAAHANRSLECLLQSLTFIYPDVIDEAPLDSTHRDTVMGVQAKMREAAEDLLKHVTLRRLCEDSSVGLPRIRQTTLEVRMTRGQMEAYAHLVRERAVVVLQPTGSEPVAAAESLELTRDLVHAATAPSESDDPPDDADGSARRALCAQSGKMLAMDALLMELKADDRSVVVYSTFCDCLDALEAICNEAGHQVLRINGSTALADRRALRRQLIATKGFVVLLTMTRAAGFELVYHKKISTVVFLDTDLDESWDYDALRRVHHLGQEHEVNVYRLYAAETCEEEVLYRRRHEYNSIEMNRVVLRGAQKSALGRFDEEAFRSFAEAVEDDVMQLEVSDAGSEESMHDMMLNDDVSAIRGRFAGSEPYGGAPRRQREDTGGGNALVRWSMRDDVDEGRAAEFDLPDGMSAEGLPNTAYCVLCRKGKEDAQGVLKCNLCNNWIHSKCHSIHVLGDEEGEHTDFHCPQHECRTCFRTACEADGELMRCTDCPQSWCRECVDELVDAFGQDPANPANKCTRLIRCPCCFSPKKSE